MAEDTLLIISGEQTSLSGERPLSARGKVSGGYLSERGVTEVQANMSAFLRNLGKVLSLEDEGQGRFNVERVEVSAEITGDGRVGILGTGVNLGGSAGLKIVLRRKP